jgi:oligopeptide transport system permease protein
MWGKKNSSSCGNRFSFSAVASEKAKSQGSSLWQDAWHRLANNKPAVVSLVVLALVLFACFAGPFLPFVKNPTTINLANPLSSPSAQHWFGTDQLGRDLFSRVLNGGQVSLLVGLVATGVAVFIGVIYGAMAGYVGGVVDAIMMRFVDILFALPFLVLVILFALVVDAPAAAFTTWIVEKTGWARDRVAPITTLIPLFIAIGAIGWLTISRIVRAQVLNVKKLEFVEAAISLGLSRRRVLFRHILPNVIGPIIIYTTLAVPGIMLLESVLSFLGLGVKPPNSSWGILIKDGADRMEIGPYLLLFPSLFFATTLFALNFLGDGLRDALDPKSSKD